MTTLGKGTLSAIFWSRPRMRYPPHGDITANYKVEQGLPQFLRGRPGPTCGGVALRRGTLHACYWNSLLGALTQALTDCGPCGHVTFEVGQRERSLTSCNPPIAELA